MVKDKISKVAISMRGITGVIIILTLLFLAGAVAAAADLPDRISISSNKLYLVAGNNEQATITATVSNITSGNPVAGATVQFAVNNSLFGSFSPGTAVTDASGVATSSFTASTRSGFATLQGNVSSTGAMYSITQKIDHNKAFTVKFSHPLEGEVNTTVPFRISFFDYYGNPVDQIINPSDIHLISLHVYGPTPNDCYFTGYGHDIPNQPLDQYGNVSVSVKLTSAAGPNAVTMDQFQLIPPPAQRIITAVSSDVSSMQSTVSPSSPPGVPADASSEFQITYLLLDRFRNPVPYKDLWVNTSLDESSKFTTDNLGQVVIGYGKKADWGEVTINATAVANPLANVTDVLMFTSTAPTTMVLSANPEVMASRDALSTASSAITATITTETGGSPSTSEPVTFSLGADSYPGGPFNVTNRSSFSPTSAVTTMTVYSDEENGDATVVFYPGSFSTNPKDLRYSATATGQVTVTATWISSVDGTSTTQNIVVTWKNYPYLSAKTTLNPQKIKVNETVDVTVLLSADGWALQPQPIDVVLCTDRSGSMMYDNPDRMVNIMAAAGTFVDTMGTNDHIGLVSFGQSGTAQAITYTPSGGGGQLGPGIDSSTYDDNTYRAAHYSSSPKNYKDYATLDLPLSLNKAKVKTNINTMVPYSGTPMRSAIYKSINELKTNGSASGTVKAIILLSDGDYNWYGDPLARGSAGSSYDPESYNDLTTSYMKFSGPTSSQQNMSVYAKDNNIKIYSIGYGNDLTAGGKKTLQVLANASGGKYYDASATNIADVYTAIAGELKDTAGVDTSLSTDFTNVNVTGVSFPGADVFSYVYQMPISTAITFQNLTYSQTSYLDQSADWASHNKLNFTIGTMKVRDTWQATFRLKAKMSGSIDVFGDKSFLSFNNSGVLEKLVLPHTYLTVTQDLSSGFNPQQIKVIGFCADPAPNSHFLPVQWITTYTGAATDINEVVSYIDESGAHVPFYQAKYHVTGDTSTTRSTTFDLNTFPKSQQYSIEVRTYTDNSESTAIACSGTSYDTSGTSFIKLD